MTDSSNSAHCHTPGCGMGSGHSGGCNIGGYAASSLLRLHTRNSCSGECHDSAKPEQCPDCRLPRPEHYYDDPDYHCFATGDVNFCQPKTIARLRAELASVQERFVRRAITPRLPVGPFQAEMTTRPILLQVDDAALAQLRDFVAAFGNWYDHAAFNSIVSSTDGFRAAAKLEVIAEIEAARIRYRDAGWGPGDSYGCAIADARDKYALQKELTNGNG